MDEEPPDSTDRKKGSAVTTLEEPNSQKKPSYWGPFAKDIHKWYGTQESKGKNWKTKKSPGQLEQISSENSQITTEQLNIELGTEMFVLSLGDKNPRK